MGLDLVNGAWDGGKLCLELVGAPLLVCDLQGVVVGESPQARGFVKHLETLGGGPRLSNSLWKNLIAAPAGEPIQWCRNDEQYSLVPYPIGESHVLLFVQPMGARQPRLARQLHDQRLKGLGRLATWLLNDLRSPLSSLSLNTQLLLDARSPELEPALRDIQEATQRLEQMAQVLAAYSDPIAARRPILDLGRSLRRAAALIRGHLKQEECELSLPRFDEPSGVWVRASTVALERIFEELMLNAADASRAPKRVVVAVERDGDWVNIEVGDTGPGVPEHLMDRIFQPFFSTKPEAAGVGLFLARDSAREMGGDLVYLPQELGARFQLRLPCAEPE